MRIHKTKTLADSYECGSCSTMFRLEDLQRTYNKPGLGKYTVQPDVEECPFCGADLDLELADTIHYPAPVPRHKEIAGLIKYKYRLEANLAESDGKRIQNESTPVEDEANGEWDEQKGQQLSRHVGNLGMLALAKVQHINGTLALAEVEHRLDKSGHKPATPMHLPRTVTQNCHSGGVTIKPQSDWDNPHMKEMLEYYVK